VEPAHGALFRGDTLNPCDHRALCCELAPSARRRTLLLLHGSAGSGALWRNHSEFFSPLYYVLTPDLIGYGKEGVIPAAPGFRLDEELERLFPLLPAGERFHLAGYSYGGVIALRLALATPWRLASLTLIEPVAFPLLDRAETSAAYRAVQALRGEFTRLLDSGRKEDAMRRFLDYWSAPGAFEKLAPEMQGEMLRVAAKIQLDFDASFGADLPEDALRSLPVRTLIVAGGRSPASTRGIAAALERLLPHAQTRVFDDAGHLLPLTHARTLAQAMLDHMSVTDEAALR